VVTQQHIRAVAPVKRLGDFLPKGAQLGMSGARYPLSGLEYVKE